MKFPNIDTLQKQAGNAIVEALAPSVRRATAYISPTFVVTATRRHRRCYSITELVVKIGRPNFREREFIGLCKKSGVAFPLRNVQLKHFPAKTRNQKPKRAARR